MRRRREEGIEEMKRGEERGKRRGVKRGEGGKKKWQ